MVCTPGVRIDWYRRLQIAHVNEGLPRSFFRLLPCLPTSGVISLSNLPSNPPGGNQPTVCVVYRIYSERLVVIFAQVRTA
jgi:hypothetical protein